MIDLLRDFGAIEALLADVPLPAAARVERTIPTPPALPDVRAAVDEALRAVTLPRGRVAIGVGSRGVAKIGEIVAALQAASAEPFIFPIDQGEIKFEGTPQQVREGLRRRYLHV